MMIDEVTSSYIIIMSEEVVPIGTESNYFEGVPLKLWLLKWSASRARHKLKLPVTSSAHCKSTS